jgi:putative cofactor-binding repeat protein
MRGVIVAGAVGITLLWAGTAGAAVIHENCAHANLQNKINNAPAGSTLKIQGRCVGEFLVNKNLNLVGDPTATLDGNDAGRPLTISGATSNLSHLVITGGHISGGLVVLGGGLFTASSNVKLNHVAVKGNRADSTANAATIVDVSGGGIYSDAGTLRIENSVISGNTVRAEAGTARTYGAGISRNYPLTIVNSKIENNKAISVSLGTDAETFGGGLYMEQNGLHIKSSKVDGNLARSSGPGGPVVAQGGGIYLADTGAITIERSSVSENRASAISAGTAADALGGGLKGKLVHGTFLKTRWLGNVAHAESAGDGDVHGGALAIEPAGDLELIQSRFSGNVADAHGGSGQGSADGGAMEVSDGRLILRNTTVDGNRATAPEGALRQASGGGIFAVPDTLMFSSTVSRNTASSNGGQTLGGGLLVEGSGTSRVTNSTVASNHANGGTARGGGIETFAGTLVVLNATISGNTAKLGGGIYNEGSTATLEGTILAGNQASGSGDDCGGSSIGSAGRNLVSKTAGCTFAPTASDIVNKGAKLGPLGQYGGPTQTIPLQSGSPALDHIVAAQCDVSKDQRGVKRPQGNRCDIGAFEVKQ